MRYGEGASASLARALSFGSSKIRGDARCKARVAEFLLYISNDASFCASRRFFSRSLSCSLSLSLSWSRSLSLCVFRCSVRRCRSELELCSPSRRLNSRLRRCSTRSRPPLSGAAKLLLSPDPPPYRSVVAPDRYEDEEGRCVELPVRSSCGGPARAVRLPLMSVELTEPMLPSFSGLTTFRSSHVSLTRVLSPNRSSHVLLKVKHTHTHRLALSDPPCKHQQRDSEQRSGRVVPFTGVGAWRTRRYC